MSDDMGMRLRKSKHCHKHMFFHMSVLLFTSDYFDMHVSLSFVLIDYFDPEKIYLMTSVNLKFDRAKHNNENRVFGTAKILYL
jgi:hypothetical protein